MSMVLHSQLVTFLCFKTFHSFTKSKRECERDKYRDRERERERERNNKKLVNPHEALYVNCHINNPMLVFKFSVES